MLKLYLPLLKNRSVQLVLSITIVVLILLAIFSSFTHREQDKEETNSKIFPSSNPVNSNYVPLFSNTKINNPTSLFPFKKGQIPILVSSFPTSVNLVTSLNIFYYPGDPSNVLRFEIYGLNYQNTETNIVAYRETFTYGLQLLQERGLNHTKFKFIYSQIPTIQSMAHTWVIKYKLLP